MRTRCVLAATLAAAAVAGTATAQSQESNLGRALAATCANCHGTNGNSVGGFDVLAGESKDSLVRKMKEYKAGTRTGTIMPQLAKGYTDAQIEIVAGWLAAQKPVK